MCQHYLWIAIGSWPIVDITWTINPVRRLTQHGRAFAVSASPNVLRSNNRTLEGEENNNRGLVVFLERL